MGFVRQAVIDRHAGMRGERLGLILREAAIFDAVIHTAENARRVFHRLLLADLCSGRAEIGDVRALVVGGDLEAGSGARRVLLEDQGDVLAPQSLFFVAAILGLLERGGEPQQKADLVR